MVYAKCTRIERRSLWQDLGQIADGLDGQPWGGDFNVIENLKEYSGRSEPDLVGMSEFHTALSQCALSELPVVHSSDHVR